MGSSLQGFEDIITKLNNLSINVDVAIDKGIMRNARRVANEAKLLCPVNDGRLRNSIHVHKGKGDKYSYTDNNGSTYSGALTGKTEDHTAIVGTNVEYASYVEFGTGPAGYEKSPEAARELGINYKSDKWKVNIPGVGVRWVRGQIAKPFLYPAFKRNKAVIIQDIRNVMNEQIRKVAKK
jgi:HK97 gp10 family phage protein